MTGHFLAILLVFASTAAAAPPPSRGQAAIAAHFNILMGQAKSAMLRDPKEAVTRALAAERYADNERNPLKRAVMKATAQWLRGDALLRVNDLPRARRLIDGALAIARVHAPGSRLLGNLLLSRGGLNTASVNVSQALFDLQAAYVIFQKIGDVRSQSKALQSIAALYQNANDNRTALKYFNQALAKYAADPGLSFSIYNNRGNAFQDLGRYAEAHRQYQSAIDIAQDLGSNVLAALAYFNLGEVELKTHELDQAERTIQSAFKLTATPEAADFRRPVYGLAAQAAFQRRNMAQALLLLEKRFAGVDLDHTTAIDREAHRTAYNVYRAVGRDDLAIRHLAALKRLDDEATDLARSTNAALMGARFDFANQELKIAKLRQDELARNVAYERERVRSQRLIFFGAAGATLIIIAMLLYALRTSRRARTRVQAANDDLAVTNDALGQALAAKTEFLATTSHEIRTPLNGILGMTQVMLIDDTLGIATRDRLKVVHEAGVTMRTLVDDILDVAKMETGNLTVEHAPFDLRAMMESSTTLWTAQAEAKGLSFIRMLDDCPGLICGDAARVRQIVFNLVGNAVKFTAEGSISIAVTATAGRYRIAVRDSGIGIPADKHEAIFESFRQADTSTTRQFGGTGLGLSICRNLARAMGGDVIVESVEGEGATFTVHLPLVVAETAAIEPCATTGAIDLLIVDRNPITRSMLKTLFAPHLSAIEFAPSMTAAIERVAAGGVAHVIADDATVRLGDPLPDLAALSALDTAVTLLWPVSAESEAADLVATGIALLVAKPVAGAALVEKLLATLGTTAHRRLVSQAA